jgi:hypothetical protein
VTVPFSRRSFLETGATLASTALVARQVVGQDLTASPAKDKLDGALRSVVERGDVPGVVAAVTDPAETVYLAAFGERGLGQGVAMTTDTVFYLASMTKPVTATAAMQLSNRASSSWMSRFPDGCRGRQSFRCWTVGTLPAIRSCEPRSARSRCEIC